MIRRFQNNLIRLTQIGRQSLHWWLRELSEFVPPRWRNRNFAHIEVQLGNPTATLRLVRGTETLEAGHIDNETRTINPSSLARKISLEKEKLPIWLFPPADAVLKRIIQLPRSAFANFAKFLPLEVERWTPYRSNEIAVAWKQVAQSEKSVDVELRYIPRELLIELANPLANCGIVPSLIVLGPDQDFHVAAIDFPSAGRTARTRMKRTAIAVLAVAAIALVVTDWWAAEEARRAWHEQVREETHALTQQKLLQKRIADIVGAVNASGGQSPARSESLLQLARALPPTDWLTEVSIRNRLITLRGYSANPDLLLKQLEPLATNKEVSLQGEMSLDQKLARQRFALTIQIVGNHH